ncbi:MAG: putative manganese-dependent inorganic diphosphatase [Firmicutes bacterium]|nr:putative manganese-dependent inorganic diphosphatase [Bacillota bacterium]
MRIPITAHMTPAEDLLTFRPAQPIEDVREIMGSVRHRYFPVCGAGGRYLGLISRRNLLNLKRKQLILVDHNENSQCVEGWEEAEILEVIDHHRIGNLQTEGPIYFINRPVGCTATIIYQIYQSKQITPTPLVAGLLLAAILSDTLAFRSPTCTPLDQEVAAKLEEIAGIDAMELAVDMFEAAEDLEGESAEEIFFADFKKFALDEVTIGVGQASFMSQQNLEKARALLQPYAASARAKAGTDLVFFMLTNIKEQTSLLIWNGEGAEALVKEAFGAEAAEGDAPLVETPGGSARLPGIVSRKKQLVPSLLNALRQQ